MSSGVGVYPMSGNIYSYKYLDGRGDVPEEPFSSSLAAYCSYLMTKMGLSGISQEGYITRDAFSNKVDMKVIHSRS